jgi:AcrR family transcriptional regulator
VRIYTLMSNVESFAYLLGGRGGRGSETEPGSVSVSAAPAAVRPPRPGHTVCMSDSTAGAAPARDRAGDDKPARDGPARDRPPRDRGSPDGGGRDQGSRDQGSRDQGSRDQGSRERGSRERGSRDQGSRPKRSEATRVALLAAAARVFAAAGYADASVDEIVGHAGTSVGTLYHHFNSKAELWTELYHDYQSRQQHRSARAFRAAVASGQADPMALFLAGTRAFLEGAWTDRHIGKIFVAGGGPPGFDALVRRRFHDWLAINAAGFDAGARPFSPTMLLVLTAIVTEAGREITALSSRREARAFIDDVLGLMGQLHPDDAGR